MILFNRLFRSGVLMLIMLLFSCSRDCNTYKVPGDFKQYFYYPEGSWWVYKNQYGVYDTLLLTGVEEEMHKLQSESCDKYEKITNHYLSSLSGESTAKTYYFSNGIFFFCFDNIQKSYFNDMTSFPVLLDSSHTIFACNSDVEWSVKDSVVTGNKTYHDVYQNQSYDIPETIDTVPVTCYFVKNAGLIKKVMKNGEVWELVEYRIK